MGPVFAAAALADRVTALNSSILARGAWDRLASWPFWLMVTAAILALTAWQIRRWRARRSAAHDALRAAVRGARLSTLQVQIQPHFLFNVLNSLLPLIDSDPTSAKQIIIRVGDLLRQGLFAETAPLVTFQRDLELLETYLDIQRLRLRERIQVEIEADSRARSAAVPSFLLQPLVENAIKHAADPTGGVRIRIEARTEEKTFSVRVQDDGPGMPTNPDSPPQGVGLRNIERRLEALFPQEHTLRLTNRTEGGCEALVTFPLSFADPDPHPTIPNTPLSS